MPATMSQRPARTPAMATRSANGRSTIIQRPDGRWHGWVSMGALPSGSPDRRHVSAKTQSAVAAKVKGLERQRDTGAVTSAAGSRWGPT